MRHENCENEKSTVTQQILVFSWLGFSRSRKKDSSDQTTSLAPLRLLANASSPGDNRPTTKNEKFMQCSVGDLKNYMTRFYLVINYQITFLFFGSQKIRNFHSTTFRSLQKFFLHYAIWLFSCEYEPLTQGNGLNPNNDGSRTERDVPKQSSHVRYQCTLNFECCTIKGEFYCPHTICPSILANMAEEEVAAVVAHKESGKCKAGTSRCW